MTTLPSSSVRYLSRHKTALDDLAAGQGGGTSDFTTIDTIIDFAGNTDHIVTLPFQVPAEAGLYSFSAIIIEELVTTDEAPWAEIQIGSRYANLDDVFVNTKKSNVYTLSGNTQLTATFSFSALPITITCRGSDNDKAFTAGKIRLKVNYLNTLPPDNV
jgi:hypothetical protein